ncbi:MAG: DUF3656 domain-containing protein [Candidatus Woesearchaeota archaeon]
MENKIFVTTRNSEEIYAAIGAGAHAITIPIEKYEKELFSYAKIQGCQAYLGCDRIITNEELSFYLKQIEAAISDGIDGLYLSDIGIASVVKSHTNIPVIISAQTKITNYESLKKFSVGDVIILSPEITRESFVEIKKRTNAIGIIVQGIIDQFYGGIKLPEMSLYPHLDEFEGLVLTIIPKGKEASDLYRTVKVYAQASKDAEEEIGMASKRPLFTGIFSKRKITKKGVFLGKVSRGCLELQRELQKGEQILINNGKRGTLFKITYILKDKERVERAEVGERIQLRYPHFKGGNSIFKMGLAKFDIPIKRRPVTLSYEMTEKGFVITLQDERDTVHASAEVMKAEKKAITKEEFEGKLCRTYNSPFRIEKISGDFTEGLHISYSTINRVRNDALAKLEEKHLDRFRRKRIGLSPSIIETQPKKTELYVKVNSLDAAMEAIDAGADLIYYDIFSPDVLDCKEMCAKQNVPLYLITPRTIQEKELHHIMKLIEHYNPEGILVGNPALLRVKAKKHLDSNFLIGNSESLNYWNLPAIVSNPINDERAILFAHGRPIMTSTRFEVRTKGEITPYGDTVLYGKHIDRSEQGKLFLDVDENVTATLKRFKMTV